jgi:thiol-disulfide isomerase/thioredoxin
MLLALGGSPVASAEGPSSAVSPAPDGLAVGTPVPSFEGEGLNDKTYTVDFPKDRATVLLFFLSGCPTCHKMIPEWNRALPKNDTVKILGIMLDREPPGFFDSMPIAFPVLRAVKPREVSRLFKIGHVPMMVRVAPNGTIEEVASGLLEPAQVARLFRK